MSRLRALGRSIEEAEDLVHEAYAETLARLPLAEEIRNLPAWLNSLVTRRLIDLWRHERVRRASGETSVSEEAIDEIIAGAGLDPEDGFIRDSLSDAIREAISALPRAQRLVVEAQVLDGLTFQEIARLTGVGVDTLKARKRYAMARLSRALNHWIDD
jgi:RNA polymerase sigma factor (sigma-70 family)